MLVAFFYFMDARSDRVEEIALDHHEYWEKQALKGYSGGPFSDHSGGLITFEADDLTKAAAIVERDPFVRHGLLGNRWVKEWAVT